MIALGYSKDLKSAAKSAITAGSDMDMMSSAYILNLKSLVDEKQIKINLIDNAVKRTLSIGGWIASTLDWVFFSKLDWNWIRYIDLK